jgi:hypothetical protein
MEDIKLEDEYKQKMIKELKDKNDSLMAKEIEEYIEKSMKKMFKEIEDLRENSNIQIQELIGYFINLYFI